ncbi:MAG: NUDIX domain-containing protein [Steroidobacteraceae bacterium]
MLAPPFDDWPKIPYVGVGCIVIRDGRLLLVRNRNGSWSSPGGHLDFGESPEEGAARETFEEAGIRVTNIEFVALTNDVLHGTGKHYVTLWMRAEPLEAEIQPRDVDEIDAFGWFAPDAMPDDLYPYFRNLIAGRCLPPAPANFPAELLEARARGAGERE